MVKIDVNIGVYRVNILLFYQINNSSSDVSRNFWEILYSAGNFGVGAQKDMIVLFEELFSVINMYGMSQSIY